MLLMGWVVIVNSVVVLYDVSCLVFSYLLTFVRLFC